MSAVGERYVRALLSNINRLLWEVFGLSPALNNTESDSRIQTDTMNQGQDRTSKQDTTAPSTAAAGKALPPWDTSVQANAWSKLYQDQLDSDAHRGTAVGCVDISVCYFFVHIRRKGANVWLTGSGESSDKFGGDQSDPYSIEQLERDYLDPKGPKKKLPSSFTGDTPSPGIEEHSQSSPLSHLGLLVNAEIAHADARNPIACD